MEVDGENNENQCILQGAGGGSICRHKIVTGLDDNVEGINMYYLQCFNPEMPARGCRDDNIRPRWS